MTEQPTSFRSGVKNYCHILSDRIVIAPHETIKESEYKEDENMFYKKYINNLYLFEICATFFIIQNAQRHIQNEDWLKLSIMIVLFAVILFSVVWNWNKSNQSVVYFKDIKSVDYTANTKLKTAFFNVVFTTGNGREKVRIVPVYYKENPELAVDVFKNAGLYKEIKVVNG